MKRILLLILLLIPAFLYAQEEKDLSELSTQELAKMLGSESRNLKTATERSDKVGMSHAYGNLGDIFLAVAKKLSSGEQTDKAAADKKTYLAKSIDNSNKAINTAEEVGDVDQMRNSLKTLSAAQKMSGNLKESLASYKRMLGLKKSIFTARKTGDLEKKQIEYKHDRREDSIRKQQAVAEAQYKEQQEKAKSSLTAKQWQLDSANRAISTKELEKANVALALQKTQNALTIEKQNALEKEKQLTLVEQEKALATTNAQLQESKVELQKSQLQLQQNKLQMAQEDLYLKDRKLGRQRTWIYVGFAGTLVLAIFSFFIIRERKKAVTQKLRAERSEQFKQQFIANISHEIRTPMNAINGMVSLLLNKNPRPEQESYLHAIAKSSDILLHVINDVLDLSKIEAGKLELETIDFSMADTIKQVKDTLSYRAEDKGLQLVTEIDEKLDDVLVGDPFRLNQVLINLGGNALKFTEKGGVHIQLQLEKKEHDNVWIKFAIADTGIGIPADKLPKLFENFTQVSSSDTRKFGGTGLGLSISKQLVELQGGKLAVESQLGVGTTFSFILKYPVGSANRLKQRLAAERNADGSILNGLRILIADDNEYNRLVVDETLHLMAKVHTHLVVNGQEAIDALEKNDYNIILMDVQMPVMNGTDATKYIRANLPSPKNNIPIVALTASVLRADLNLCFASGMTAYIPKPFKPWQLINTIADVTGRERNIVYEPAADHQNGHSNGSENGHDNSNANGNGTSSSNGHSNATVSIDPSVYDLDDSRVTNLDYLHKFCDGNEKRMHKFINAYLNALPAFSTNIDNAVATKDYIEIALHVHSFKPKWMMMGMKRTNELGIKIDQLCKAQNETVFEKLPVLMDDIKKSAEELQAVL